MSCYTIYNVKRGNMKKTKAQIRVVKIIQFIYKNPNCTTT